MGCCGCCADMMRAINGNEEIIDPYDETNVIDIGKVNNNNNLKKDSDDEDIKENNKKKFFKIHHLDKNIPNKMSQKFVNRAIGTSAAGIITAPFIEPKY